MTSKAAKAIAVLQHVSGAREYNHALAIYDALANTFEPIDVVLADHDASRFMLYENMDDADFWEAIEDTALAVDDAHKHFGE